ncbi:MAG: hypothetical protein ACXWPM_10915, partial [Bdellovibrionota bacterium]
DVIAEELAVLKRMQEDPAGYYFELRANARRELATGKTDFGFPPFRSVLKRIKLDLAQRQLRKFGPKYATRLKELEAKAEALLAHGDPPYKTSVRFFMNEYNPMLDTIFGERHPELMASNFHRHHAEPLLEKFLAKAPDLLMHFSFEGVGFDYFLRTRTAPFQLVGFDLRGLDDLPDLPFADGFLMKPSEFSWHDTGHIDFMAFRDIEYINSADKPIERIVWEWESTRLRILAFHDRIRAADKVLGDSTETLLSELLHERGFQYSLTVLKQELETPKWVRAILRKMEKGFYPNTPKIVFDRLEEARKGLLAEVNRMRVADQEQWIKTLRADVVPVKITHTPEGSYSTGKLVRVELKEPGKAVIVARNPAGSEQRTGIREFLSVQMDPTKASPFSEASDAKIESMLWLRGQAHAIQAGGQPRLIEAIVIDRTKALLVQFKDGTMIPLSQVAVPAGIPKEIPRLSNLEKFEINQVLGNEDRGTPLEYTIKQPVQTYIGTLKPAETVSGHPTVTIKTVEGKTLTVPLTEVRVDPLTKGDLH